MGFAIGRKQHIIFRDEHGHLYELSWEAGKNASRWAARQLTVGPHPLSKSNPAAYVQYGNQHVVYRDLQNGLHEFWWDGVSGEWRRTQLTLPVGPGLPADSDPTGYVHGVTQRITYRNERAIHELWWDGHWYSESITGNVDSMGLFGLADAVGTPSAFTHNDRQCVVYIDSGGQIHELSWP